MIWCSFDQQYPFNFLDSLQIFGTYEDWLMGGPKLSQIPELVQRWESRARRLHPGWPVHSAIRPEDYRKDGFLPGHVCIGYFRSNWTREPDGSDSAMVIVWYQEKNPIDDGLTLPALSEEVWHRMAKDFDY